MNDRGLPFDASTLEDERFLNADYHHYQLPSGDQGAARLNNKSQTLLKRVEIWVHGLSYLEIA
jgi:hypothetical protein